MEERRRKTHAGTAPISPRTALPSPPSKQHSQAKRLKRSYTVPPKLDPLEILFKENGIVVPAAPQLSPPRRGDAIDHRTKVISNREQLPEISEKSESRPAFDAIPRRKIHRRGTEPASQAFVPPPEKPPPRETLRATGPARHAQPLRWEQRHHERRGAHFDESIESVSNPGDGFPKHFMPGLQSPVHILPVPVYVPTAMPPTVNPSLASYYPGGGYAPQIAQPESDYYNSLRANAVTEKCAPLSDAAARYRALRRDPRHQVVFSRNGVPVKLPDGKLVTEHLVHCVETIQRVVRGHLGRVAFVERHLPNIVSREQALARCAVGVLNECIEEDIIPDLLIEILTHEGKDYDALPPDEQEIADAADSVERAVVGEMSRTILTEIVRSYVADYLDEQLGRRKNNPLWLAVNDVVESFLEREVRNVVAESCSDLVSDHLFMQNFDSFLQSAIDPNIEEVAAESLKEARVEVLASDMLEDAMGAISREVAETCFDEDVKNREADRERLDLLEIAKIASANISRTALKLMLKVIASNGEGVQLKLQFQILLREHIARGLLRRVERTHQVRELFKNVALRHMHQIVHVKAAVKSTLADGAWASQLSTIEDDIDMQEDMLYGAQ